MAGFRKNIIALIVLASVISGCKSNKLASFDSSEIIFGDDGLTDYDAMRADPTTTPENFIADSLLIEAEYNLKNSLYEEAILNLDQAIVLKPISAEAYYLRGHAKFELNDYTGSLQDANKVLEIDSVYMPAYMLRADNYTFLKDYKSAEADYNYLISETPDNRVAVYRRGFMFLQSGNYKAAIIDFDAFINGTDEIPGVDLCGECYQSRAQAHFQLGNLKQACTDWQAGSNLGDQKSAEELKKYCN